MNYFSSKILMISPEKFRANELTQDDNVFQSRNQISKKIQKIAYKEFKLKRRDINATNFRFKQSKSLL